MQTFTKLKQEKQVIKKQPKPKIFKPPVLKPAKPDVKGDIGIKPQYQFEVKQREFSPKIIKDAGFDKLKSAEEKKR